MLSDLYNINWITAVWISRKTMVRCAKCSKSRCYK